MMAPKEKERLELYHVSMNQDRLDHDLILKLLGHIHRHQAPGAMLVFLPGYEDISTMCDLVSQDQILGKETSIVILHSQIGSAESKKAFQQPPRGQRKIVLATNVAETGVTIPDIVYVVDTGKVKLKTFDSLTNTSMLKCEWISQTSATQRKGRAGRCQAGQVYRLFSSSLAASMAQFTTPEILRTSLLALCLQTKLLAPPNTPIADFLAKVPDPPPFLITRNAVQNLKTMEALDSWEEITPLGLHLLDIPLDPWLGKILLHAVMLKCLEPVLTITCKCGPVARVTSVTPTTTSLRMHGEGVSPAPCTASNQTSSYPSSQIYMINTIQQLLLVESVLLALVYFDIFTCFFFNYRCGTIDLAAALPILPRLQAR